MTEILLALWSAVIIALTGAYAWAVLSDDHAGKHRAPKRSRLMPALTALAASVIGLPAWVGRIQ